MRKRERINNTSNNFLDHDGIVRFFTGGKSCRNLSTKLAKLIDDICTYFCLNFLRLFSKGSLFSLNPSRRMPLHKKGEKRHKIKDIGIFITTYKI